MLPAMSCETRVRSGCIELRDCDPRARPSVKTRSNKTTGLHQGWIDQQATQAEQRHYRQQFLEATISENKSGVDKMCMILLICGNVLRGILSSGWVQREAWQDSEV